MKIFFFDIETVPTDQSLKENGLLDAQIKLDEPELIKKLSLSAVNREDHLPLLCLRAIIDEQHRSLTGRRNRDHQKLLEARRRLQSLRRP